MAHGHHHRHHHGRHSKGGYDGRGVSRPKLLMLGAVAGVVLVLMLLAIIFGASLIEPEAPVVQVDPEKVDQPTATFEYDGRIWEHQEYRYTTILFIGVDRPELTSTAPRAGGQADFLLLVTIDRVNHTVNTLQIDRDTMVPVQVYGAFGNPAGTRVMQICLAYAFGTDPQKGCENTVLAVETLLGGVKIDQYVALDMDGMALLNDALGGVTVTLEEDFTIYDPAMKKGATITLQGDQAAYYLRGRMDVGDGTNVGRMSRQRNFMQAAVMLLDTRMAQDPTYLVTVFNALDGHLVTSCDEAWLINQAYAVRTYPRTENVQLRGEHLVGADGFVEFHPDTDALMKFITGTFCE